MILRGEFDARPEARGRLRHRVMGLAASTALATGMLAAAWAGPGASRVAAATGGPDHGVVLGIGSNAHHQLDLPEASGYGIVAISARGELAMALKWDGTVIAWGDNSHGQANVPAGLSGVKAISAGGTFAVALKSNGEVVVWGSNQSHQTEVPAAAKSGIVAIAAGHECVIAVKSNGTVVGWGNNTWGQLNTPRISLTVGGHTSSIPVVLNLKAVSANYHVLGLQKTGKVVAWGAPNFGKATVPSGLTNVAAVAAGYEFSLALRTSGSIWGWGDNSKGQLNVPSPGTSGYTAVAAGDYHALALKNGNVVAWGNDSSGETMVPSQWSNPSFWYGGTVAVAAGHNFSLALWGVPRIPPPLEAPSATAGNGTALVGWQGYARPTYWGAPITHYTVTSSPGGKTCTAGPVMIDGKWGQCVVTGLTNGTSYTFTVTVTNGLGTSPASPPSAPVTPAAYKAYSVAWPSATSSAAGADAAGASAVAAASAGASSPASSAASSPASSAGASSQMVAAASAGGSGAPNGGGQSPTPGAPGSGGPGGDNTPLVIIAILIVGAVSTAGGAIGFFLIRAHRLA